MVVQEIQTAQEYDRVVEGGRSTVVVEFYATWCGPCKAIGPVFAALSEHPKFNGCIVFVKVNVENVRAAALKARVTSMPTFVVFVNGKEVERILGAHRQQLEWMIDKYAKSAVPISSKVGRGERVLSIKQSGGYPSSTVLVIGKRRLTVLQLDCLNMDKKYPVRSIFEKDGYLQSDVDEQLLLYIPVSVTGCRGPTQRVESIAYDANCRAVIPLRFVKFQRVISLVLFVESNKDNQEVSRIDNLTVIGETVEEAANNGIRNRNKQGIKGAALANHPDKVPAERRAAAERRFKEVKEAYEVLYDDQQRRLFDLYGLAGLSGGAGPVREENEGGGEWVVHEEYVRHVFPQRVMRSFLNEMSAFSRMSQRFPSSLFDEWGFGVMGARYMDPLDFFDEMLADPWFRW
ncbi:hypothetical protein PORY_000056 [Pneumocystis oryctolagi]|uniref:Uncharacterized protein n=1 Tax=Pneumocystis oryctolagi TaxID=42067 RepID=A0ACB7CGB1_9ASCO|nr:hypothetical protein PORY_000056 [Pneumocystis oryctolagi]